MYNETSNENSVTHVYYSQEELPYYYWGYICTGHDGLNFFSFDEAAAFAIQYLGKEKLSGKPVGNFEETPWKIEAMRDGWIAAYTNNGTNAKILELISMYKPYTINASYLIEGLTTADMIDVALYVYTGGSVSVTRKLTVKVGLKC